jgi:hypothetical protein
MIENSQPADFPLLSSVFFDDVMLLIATSFYYLGKGVTPRPQNRKI